jgi:DNA-directed RNA polymerase II subunit RPB1
MNIDRISKVDFTLINPEQFRDYSVCEIVCDDIYKKNGEPKYGGLSDTRMGSCNNNILCKTCKNTSANCPGHFGHIELACPLYNPNHIIYVKKILNVTCYLCSNILVPESKKPFIMKKNKKERLNILTKHITTNNNDDKVCEKCKRIQPKYNRFEIMLQTEKRVMNVVKKEKFPAEKALTILQNISEEDIVLLGMDVKNSRPEWLLYQILPVTPPCSRPSIDRGGNLRAEDDITHKYVDIIKSNNIIRNKLNDDDSSYLDESKEYLQYHVTTLNDNSISGVMVSQQRSGRPLKSLKEKIKGKEGQIRKYLMGKRVDFSGRTVVSPDTIINIDEVGVPYSMCMKLTFPEVVNYYNIKYLKYLVKNGPNKYPGANFIIKKHSGKKFDLRHVKTEIELRYGDIVERHLCGDNCNIGNDENGKPIITDMFTTYTILNRQPSLHKASFNCHKIRPVVGKSLRLNAQVCNPYNADFDGDEMNIFVPRNYHSMMEIKDLASISKQIINPKNNSPIVGGIMDIVIGANIMTRDDTMINENVLLNILPKIKNVKKELPETVYIDDNGLKHWSGKDIMSMMIPKINYYKGGSKSPVKIVEGKIVSGTFDKGIVGASGNSLIHMISNDIDEHRAKLFLDDLSPFICEVLKMKGFSVGYGDTLITDETKSNIDSIVKTTVADVKNFINMTYDKKTKITPAEFENKIFNKLNKARDDTGSMIMKQLDHTNNFYSMISSKSKGNYTNISQIMTIVGQQNSPHKNQNGRVPLTLHNRTLPLFKRYDITPEARGFIEHSYLEGLDPHEFFFHMQSGRVGVIDTACKTASTGYIQRKLMKGLENISVKYDMTVRTENNNIIQFAYGGDNFDTTKVEKQRFELVMCNNKEFDEKYKWNSEDYKVFDDSVKVNKRLLLSEYRELKKLRNYFMENDYQHRSGIYYPINIFRIVKQAVSKYGLEENKKTDISPKYLLEKREEIMREIRINCDTDYPFNEMNDYNYKLLRTLIRSKLSSKVVIVENHLTVEALNWVVDNIKERFYRALIQPGTNIGIVTASSIGEPCTQMSVRYNTRVKVNINGENQEPKIGKLIDDYMKNKAGDVIQTHITEDGKPSHILPIPKEWNIKVPGLNYNKEKIQWRRVTEMSRHPVNGKLIRIRTKSGRTVIATPSHSFVVRGPDGKPMTIRGDQLKLRDQVPIMK